MPNTRSKKSAKRKAEADAEAIVEKAATSIKKSATKVAKTATAAISNRGSMACNRSHGRSKGSSDAVAGEAHVLSDKDNTRADSKVGMSESYLEQWFAQYQDFERTDGASVIMPDGFERLCTDLGYDMANIEPLVLMWKLECSELGTVTYDKWESSLKVMNVNNADELRTAIARVLKKMSIEEPVYKQFYQRMFNYLKSDKQKVISAEFAKDILPVIKTQDNKLFDKFVKFLDSDSEKYKTINRDQWQSLLALSKSMDSNLTGYSKEDAWPALFDEFADWVQKQN